MGENLVSIGIGVRTSENNPWLERLLGSLRTVPAGIPVPPPIIEQGSFLNRIEKKIRLFRQCRSKFLVLFEDDTEVLTENWLLGLINSMLVFPLTAIGSPAEVGFGVPQEEAQSLLAGQVAETTWMGGFCQIINMEAGICSDVRIQTMDDLYLSLLARSRGYRLVSTRMTVVRHTKQPWALDGVPPWEQEDRSRFGEKDGYYQETKHQQARVHEAGLLLDQFGDLARQTLPPEILAVLEPEGIPGNMVKFRPTCSFCHTGIEASQDYVMSKSYQPICLSCYERGKA